QLSEYRCLIAAAGPYFEHIIVRLQVQQLGHQRNDKRLRDGLSVTDRQRTVLIGRMRGLGRDKSLPPDRSQRCRHMRRQLRSARPTGGLAHLEHDLLQQCRWFVHRLQSSAVAAPYATEDGRWFCQSRLVSRTIQLKSG